MMGASILAGVGRTVLSTPTACAASIKEPAMNQNRLTLADILITCVVAVAVALGLDAPTWSSGPRVATPVAPGSQTTGGAAAIDPAAVLPVPPLRLATATWSLLSPDDPVRQVRTALDGLDAAALALMVDPNDGLEVIDLAEAAPPGWSPADEAATMLGSLLATGGRPQVVGYFRQSDGADDGQAAAYRVGIVTCCWARSPDAPPAPAGWLFQQTGDQLTWRMWLWLGDAGVPATTDDLIRAWAASGEWDVYPAGGPVQPVVFHRLD
jgi:hypothetical protein